MGYLLGVILGYIIWKIFGRYFFMSKIDRAIHKVVRAFSDLKRTVEHMDTPEYKLEQAQKAIIILRDGYWVNRDNKKIGLDADRAYGVRGYVAKINVALECRFSYEQIGTTRDEVITFRNGEAHKTAARFLLERERSMSESGSDRRRLISLAEDAPFVLEEIGTTIEELDAIERERYRRTYEVTVSHFRKYATGEWNIGSDSDAFVKTIEHVTSLDGLDFKYEDLGTTKEECEDLIRLARRRNVLEKLEYLRTLSANGDTNLRIPIDMLSVALKKSDLTLEDLGSRNEEIEMLQQRAYVNAAMKLLEELRNPGVRWFYSGGNQGVQFYAPALRKCIPGDPLYYVNKIRENLKLGQASLEDVETNENEIAQLVRNGHLESAKFLLSELERVSKTKRATQFERILQLTGGQVFDLERKIDRITLEDQYPIQRDMDAIEYHLRGAGVQIEEVGSSSEKLLELKSMIEAR